MTTIPLVEVSRETYGHDDRAINRHERRQYRASSGKLYMLSRTLDGIPPFFEAHGPFDEEHQGILPRLPIDGQEYWGDGWSWRRAFVAFRNAVHNCEARLPTPTKWPHRVSGCHR